VRQGIARLRQRDFLLLTVYWVAIGYMWQGLGVLILPDIVQNLVGNAHKGTALSLLEAIGTVVAVVWQPVAGTLSDRTHTRWGRRRPYLVGGTAGDLLFLLGLALSGAFWVLIVFYTLLQLASNTAQGPYQGLAPDVVPQEQRGTSSGYYGLANLVGLLTGSIVVAVIQAAAGPRPAIGSIALLLLVATVVTVCFVPERRATDGAKLGSPLDVVLTTFTRPLRHPGFAWLMGSRLLILMGLVGVQSFALFFFRDVFFPHSADAATLSTGALVAVVVVVAGLVTWPAVRLSDRLGRRKPLILLGGALSVAGVLVLLFSGYRLLPTAVLSPAAAILRAPAPVAQTLLSGLLVGAGLGAFLSVDWAFIMDVIPGSDEAGLFFGFSNIATAGSGVIARLAAGSLLDHFNAGPPILNLPGGYPVVFVLFIGWLVVGTLLILPIRERGRPLAAQT
jgi:MFS family permease